jgi:glycosyltransferase involved in cell wall biosynthesis
MRELTIDARLLSTGIGSYTFNLISRLKGCGDLYLRALTVAANQGRLQPFCDRVDVVNAAIYSAHEQFSIPMATRQTMLLHVPHYNVPLAYMGVRLVTIHDLTHILDCTFRKTLKSRLYGKPMLRFAARSADHIFTVSEYSKMQIVRHLDVPPEKVTVTYNGVGKQFCSVGCEDPEVVRQRFTIPGKFILFVGNLKPHKNVPTLLRAFAKVRDTLELHLVIIGDDASGRPALQRLAAELAIQGSVNFIRSVQQQDLPSLYSAASLVVMPSFEEGFGLPVIEAMACGTPVVCSNAASLPEVAGDAACMFDPHDDDSLADAIQRVLGSESMQADMRQKGIKQATKFSWNDVALRHYQIYSRYLN